MALSMEWGWDWDRYLDSWPAQWLFILEGKRRLNQAREEASKRG